MDAFRFCEIVDYEGTGYVFWEEGIITFWRRDDSEIGKLLLLGIENFECGTLWSSIVNEVKVVAGICDFLDLNYRRPWIAIKMTSV